MWLVEKIKFILNKKALHQTGFVTVGSLINGLSLLALNIILARALNQELFGIFSLSVLALSTVAEMSDFGLNAGLLRFAPYYISTGQDDKLKQLVKTIWRWRVNLVWVLTIGGLILGYPVAKYILGQNKVGPYIIYASLGIGGVVLLGFSATFLQAQQRFLYNAIVQSLKGFSRLVLGLFFMLIGVHNVFVYLSIYIFVPWVLFLINYRTLPANFRQAEIDTETKQKLHSQLAHFSFWLTISSLVSIFSSRVDQIMISHYLGLAQVAVFTVAWQLLQFFPVLYGSITSVLIPKISSLADKEALAVFVSRTFKWVMVATFGAAILIYPSQYLISFLFGQKYLSAMPLYLVFSYSILFNVLAIPFSLAVTAFNRTHLVAISGLVQLAINVICNFVFIPRYGIMGAAYTFAASNVVLFTWNLLWALYLIKKKDFKII